MAVKLAVHLQDVVALRPCGLDERILAYGIVDVEYYQIAVLVGLLLTDGLGKLFAGKILAVDRLPEHESLRLLGELLVGQYAVLDEYFQIVPLLLVVGTHRREELLQAVGHLARDVARNLLHVGVALQIASRDVERNVGRVDHAVQQRQVFGYYSVDLIGNEDLIRVELDLVLLYLKVVVYLREIEYAREVERIVDVQMYVEQRIVAQGVKLAVELLVLLLGNLRRLARPQRVGVVDDVVLVGIDILAVLPLGFLAECDRYGQEAAVLFQQLVDLILLAVLCAIFR